MKKDHPINLTCSFCSKSQHEVRKLIAGPTVYICDECIGLCNRIIAEELSPEREIAAASARGILSGLVAQVARVSELLHECATHAGSPLPEAMRENISQLVTAARALHSDSGHWSEAESDSPGSLSTPAALRPTLATLARTADALRALRPAVEKLVPGKQLRTIDEAIGNIVEVRGVLFSIAAK